MAKESSATKKDAQQSTELALHNAALEIPDEQIPDTIEGVSEWILENEKGVRKVALVYWWNIGKMIAKVQSDEGKYGSKAVERLAEESGKNERLLYHAHNFYKDHPEFSNVESMAIEWSSVREIQRLPDPKARVSMEKKAEKENLTVREVKEAVNEQKNKGKPKDKGSKPKGPNALTYFIKLDTFLANMQSGTDTHLKDLSAMLARVSDEDLTPDEDYNVIAEGDDKKDPLVVQISKKAQSVIEKLQRYVVPLKDTFNDEEDGTEDSGAEDAQEEA